LEPEILETYVDMKKLITCGLLLGLGWSVQAQTVLLTENFNYVAGTTLQSNGWTAHSAGGTNPIQVTNGGLSWSTTNYEGSGIGNAAAVNNTGSDENRPFTSFPSTGDVYVSFLMRVNNVVTTTNSGYFLHIGEYSNTSSPTFTSINPAHRGRTYIAPGSNASKFRLGLTFNSSTVPNAVGVDITNDLDTARTYLVVLKYSFVQGANNDSVSLFVFADGANINSEPTTPTLGPLAGSASDLTVAQYLALRQYAATQNITLDGILVKDSWNLIPRATNTWNGTSWSNGPVFNNHNIVISGNYTMNLAFTAFNLTIENGATLSYGAAANLNVKGNVVNNGTIDLGTSKILFMEGKYSGSGVIKATSGRIVVGGAGEFGSMNFDQTTDGSTNTLDFFIVNRKSTGSVSVSNKVVITNNIELRQGELITNGHVHLRSASATTTAQIIGGTNANLSGNVTVERFLPWASTGNNGFRFVGHPLRNAPLVNTVNNLPTANNTLITYNETSNAYEGVNNRAGNWPQGTGYGVFTNATNTISFTGELQLSAVNNLALSNANARWNYLANPFPTTLDWDEVVRTDVQNAQWIWVKDNVTEGGGNWAAYVDGVGTSGGSRYLAPMQGFMTRAAATGSPSLSFPTSARAASQTPSYQRVNSQSEYVRITLTKISNNSSSEAIVRFRQQASSQFEPAFDAEFVSDMVNATPDLYTTDAQGVRYSINSMAPLTGRPQAITLQTETFGAGNFSLNFNTSSMTSSASIQLEDTQTGQFTPISNGQNVAFTASASDAANRFRLHFNGLSTSVESVGQENLTAHVHQGTLFIKGTHQLHALQIFDLSGRMVFRSEKLEIGVDGIQPNLTPGIYVVRLQGAQQVQNIKLKF
jgi:hypothetical protein